MYSSHSFQHSGQVEYIAEACCLSSNWASTTARELTKARECDDNPYEKWNIAICLIKLQQYD